MSKEGNRDHQFISVAPTTTEIDEEGSDSFSFTQLEQRFLIEVYVEQGLREGTDVAFNVAASAYWDVHQTLRNLLIEGFQVVIDSSERVPNIDINAELYQIVVHININEDTAPCSQIS